MKNYIVWAMLISISTYLYISQENRFSKLALYHAELSNLDVTEQSSYPPIFLSNCTYASFTKSYTFKKNGIGSMVTHSKDNYEDTSVYYRQLKNGPILFGDKQKTSLLRPLSLNKSGEIKNFIYEGKIYNSFCDQKQDS